MYVPISNAPIGIPMKLLFCKNCCDVFKLDFEPRQCKCGEVSGHYTEDGLMAYYSGDAAVPLGFANSSLGLAIINQPETGLGECFEAFIISKNCSTFEKVDAI